MVVWLPQEDINLTDLVIFAGTTEGRILSNQVADLGLQAYVAVATDYGAELISERPELEIVDARLDEKQMRELIQEKRPRLIVDATHPHAYLVSSNIKAASTAESIPLLRVLRESKRLADVEYYPDLTSMLDGLKNCEGHIFSSLGLKSAESLATIPNFQDRLTIRVLPHSKGLKSLEDLGYLHKQIIAMQGPFSEELNYIMFQDTKADILLTKDSGQSGGYMEKVKAAKALAMKVMVLERPKEEAGYLLDELIDKIKDFFREETERA